jgi:site-specific recombinase XerD
MNQPNSQVVKEGINKEPRHVVHVREGTLEPSARRAELILGPTGPFRHLIERYLATVVPSYYKPETRSQVRSSIGKFFRFVAQDLRITDLDQIRPSTITQFIERERERGLTAICFIGHISSFFVWLISLELYDRGNPVIARLHRPKMSSQLGSSFPTR